LNVTFAEMEKLPDIAPFRHRYQEIDARMSAPDFYQDARKAAELSREHQKLRRLLNLYEELVQKRRQLEENREMLADSGTDEELLQIAREEIPELEQRMEVLENEILQAMIPPDESDSRNTVVEIRAGAGGDEASLFAADLYRMYLRYAESVGWKVEIMSSHPSECGGMKEIIFLVSGEEVYKYLKFESGVHRVQRVPDTESQGRIHTSTVTVAVLPEAEEVDLQIAPDELEITITRASGPGGQHVNTTDSAVQILHKPSGMIVVCADERSQLKNRLKAMTILRSRLLQKKEEEERAKYAAQRKSQVGTGDRSERIRTYNFPQSRLTDHRIGLTLHSLPQVMDGALQPLLDALLAEDNKQKMEEMLAKQHSSHQS
jgi:peptide chain release factor 1